MIRYLSCVLHSITLLTMYIINATLGPYILKRVIVDTFVEAKHLAKTLTQEKIWKIENDTVFFGDALIKVYNIDTKKSSNYIDRPICSFADEPGSRSPV